MRPLPMTSMAAKEAAIADEGQVPIKISMVMSSATSRGGGVPESVSALCRALHAPPLIDVGALALVEPDEIVEPAAWAPVPLSVSPIMGARAFGYAPGLPASIRDQAPDLLHVHGLWMYPSVATRRWGSATKGPYVVSPHGMLDPWALANSRWKKAIAKHLYEDRHLRDAACIHALCDAEAEAVRRYGLSNPICVIPNGVALPALRPVQRPAWRSSLPADAKILLFLGRLTPKKGLVELIEAWADVSSQSMPGWRRWRLVLAGWGEQPFVEQLQVLVRARAITDAVHFVGPQFGAAKTATFQAADAFVLPSVSEGLPMAALEAWAHSLPALLTPQCNLPEGFSADAALRIEAGRAGIAAGLRRLSETGDNDIGAMGANGRRLVAERFHWPDVARDMAKVYRWLLGLGARPDCVRIK